MTKEEFSNMRKNVLKALDEMENDFEKVDAMYFGAANLNDGKFVDVAEGIVPAITIVHLRLQKLLLNYIGTPRG